MRRPTESGSAIVEVVWLGILLLIPMVWIVLSVFEVQRGAFGVTAAARSAGRAYALAPDDVTGSSRRRQPLRSRWPTKASATPRGGSTSRAGTWPTATSAAL